MSFDQFLLAVESWNLSQADNIKVSSFSILQKHQFLNGKSYSHKKKNVTWQSDIIIQIVARLRSKHPLNGRAHSSDLNSLLPKTQQNSSLN